MTDTQLAQPQAPTGPPPLAVLERMYEVMRTVTVADERARAEAKAGRMPAAFYPVRGLEGVCAALGARAGPAHLNAQTPGLEVRVGSKWTPCASRTVQSRDQSWRLRAAHCSKTTSA